MSGSAHIELPTIDPTVDELLNQIATTYNHEIFNALQPVLIMASIHEKAAADPASKLTWQTILSSLEKIQNVVRAINMLAQQPSIPKTEYIEGIDMIDVQKILSNS